MPSVKTTSKTKTARAGRKPAAAPATADKTEHIAAQAAKAAPPGGGDGLRAEIAALAQLLARGLPHHSFEIRVSFVPTLARPGAPVPAPPGTLPGGPIQYRKGGEPIGGGLPTSADGTLVKAPAAGSHSILDNQVGGNSNRWVFVAVPYSDGTGGPIPPAAIQNYFSQIQFSNVSGAAGVYGYVRFAALFPNAVANVNGGPKGGYALSTYWVELFYLGAVDTLMLPTGAIVPAGLLVWTEPAAAY